MASMHRKLLNHQTIWIYQLTRLCIDYLMSKSKKKLMSRNLAHLEIFVNHAGSQNVLFLDMFSVWISNIILFTIIINVPKTKLLWKQNNGQFCDVWISLINDVICTVLMLEIDYRIKYITIDILSAN